MPSDVVYDYAGPSFGTKETCEAQSFILLSAAGLILMSNILLNIYYLYAPYDTMSNKNHFKNMQSLYFSWLHRYPWLRRYTLR